MKIAAKVWAVLLVMMICLMGYFSFAQDSSGVVIGNGSAFISDKVMVWLTVLITVYELIVRLFPTVKNISIISFIMHIITKVIPNKSPQGKKDFL